MTEQATVNDWLSRLPWLTAPVQLDADGVCALTPDQESLIMVETRPGAGVCHIYSPVMPVPEEGDLTEWLTEALALNLYGLPLAGCWLAYARETRLLVLCVNLPVTGTTAETFGNTLQTALASMRWARARLLPDPDAADEFSAESESEASA